MFVGSCFVCIETPHPTIVNDKNDVLICLHSTLVFNIKNQIWIEVLNFITTILYKPWALIGDPNDVPMHTEKKTRWTSF